MAGRLMASMGQSWRRLVFRCQQPKFELLRVCDDGFSSDDISGMIGPLCAKGDACDHCLGDWSIVWLRRLKEQPLRTRDALIAMVAAMPPSSAK
eukprot:7005825-Pyramimonas_sp.AAC.1